MRRLAPWLFLLGLLVAATSDPLRASGREATPERGTVRELSAALVKVVRGLVASGQHTPVAAPPASTDDAPCGACSTPLADLSPDRPRIALLRHALLDLPPPARA